MLTNKRKYMGEIMNEKQTAQRKSMTLNRVKRLKDWMDGKPQGFPVTFDQMNPYDLDYFATLISEAVTFLNEIPKDEPNPKTYFPR